MRSMLDSMSRPKFSLYSALNNSLLKLLLIRVSQLGTSSHSHGHSHHSSSPEVRALDGVSEHNNTTVESLEHSEACLIECYRREYFGALCKWDLEVLDAE